MIREGNMKQMKKFLLLFILCFLTGAAFLSAQTAADEIETLLNTSAVTYAQAARFVLEASDTLAVADSGEAFRHAMEQKWLPKKVSANDAARLDGIALLLMGSFKIKGGLLYSISKSPHFAYRELTYQDTIQGRADPGMKVSGERLLFLTGRILSQQGEADAPAALTDADAGAAAEAERRRLAEAEAARRAEADAARLAEEEAIARREALAAEINVILEEQNVADTSAEATDEGVTITLSDIQFRGDSAVLLDSELGKIQEIANILKVIPGRKIQIDGHTALAGSASGRVRISQERAEAVAKYLVTLGARSMDEISVAGYGADRPVADNTTPAGMARNRRVEITILED